MSFGLQGFTKRPSTSKIEVIEWYDLNKLDNLLKIKDLSFLFDDDNNDEDDQIKIKNQSIILKKISKELKNKNFLKRTLVQNGSVGRYYYDKNDNYGILYLKNSLRGYITKEGTQDIDIKNCHPSLLLQIIKNEGLNCDELEDYIKDRDRVMENYSFDKNYFLVMINDKNFSSSIEYLNKIHKTIYTRFIPIMKEKFPDFYRDCVALDRNKNKKKSNPEGTFISKLLQEAEQDVMYYVIEFLKIKKINYGCLIYDGIHIYDKIDPNFMIEISKYVYNHTGYIVYFSNKQFPNQDLIQDQVKLVIEENDKPLEDDEVAIAIFNQYQDRIIKNNGKIYTYCNYKWDPDYQSVFNCWFQKSNLKVGKNKLLRNATSKWNYYIKQIESLLKNLPTQNILDLQTDILPYRNGYVNLLTNEFVEYNESDILYFTSIIDRDCGVKDPLKIKEVEKVVDTIFNGDKELIDEVFSFFARALGNNVRDKVSMCMVGERNSAKGYLMGALKKCYVGAVGNVSSSELFPKNGSLESAERKNGFLSNFCEYLICISEEVSPTIKLDGTTFKTICSGGDEVTFRQAFGTTNRSKIKSSYIMTCNISPKFDVFDARECLLICNMPCKFVDKIPEDGFDRGFVFKIADNNVKKHLDDAEFVNAFDWFIRSFYKKDKPDYKVLTLMNLEEIEASEEFIDDGAGLDKAIKSLYDFVEANTVNKIKKSEVSRKVKYLFPAATPQKIKNYLNNKGIIEHKATDRYYLGLRNKQPEEETSLF